MRSTPVAFLYLLLSLSLSMSMQSLSAGVTPTSCNPCISTFNVTSTTDAIDAIPGDGICASASQGCTLRAAIMEGNATALPTQVHINVPPGLYTLTIPGAGELGCLTGDLNVTRDMTITGADKLTTIIQASTIDSNTGIDRLFTFTAPSAATLNNLTLRYGNLQNGFGGAISTSASLTLNNCVVSGNRANAGSAIYGYHTAAESTVLTLDNCLVTGNTVSGGISMNHMPLAADNTTISDNAGVVGAGVRSTNASLTFSNTTISGNSATTYGGGIDVLDADVVLTNCTVSGNTAASGGSITVEGSGPSTANLTNVTSAGNSSGLFMSGAAGSITLKNTILADNATNCRTYEIANPYISAGHNLSTDFTCSGAFTAAGGDMNLTNPKLRPLALNLPGGTKTHALLPGSPAIDAAAGCSSIDQRFAKRQGAACDIGAYEFTSGARGDFDGDGKSDILWRGTQDGVVAQWFMNGPTLTAINVFGPISLSTNIEGIGDFNADGHADLVWRNPSNGDVNIWLLNAAGTGLQSAVYIGAVNTDYHIEAVGDFNGDGKDDIVWRGQTSGQVVVWLMNGATVQGVLSLGGVVNTYKIEAMGDLNGDGKSDLVWRGQIDGAVIVWLTNAAGNGVASSTFVSTVNTTYKIVSAVDMTGDGDADILWRGTVDGSVLVWTMSGATVTNVTVLGNVATTSTIEAVADLNGDGRADLVWRGQSDGAVVIFIISPTLTIQSVTFVGNVSTNYTIQGPK